MELISASVAEYSDGGEAGGANRTLGNTDTYDLGFLVDGNDRLHIQSDGSVGIGTTAATEKLEVEDTIANVPSIVLQATSGTALKLSCSSTSTTIESDFGMKLKYNSVWSFQILKDSTQVQRFTQNGGLVVGTDASSTTSDLLIKHAGHVLPQFEAESAGRNVRMKFKRSSDTDWSLGMTSGTTDFELYHESTKYLAVDTAGTFEFAAGHLTGIADIVQLSVKAHTTQTSNIAELYDSSAALLVAVSDTAMVVNGRFSCNATALGMCHIDQDSATGAIPVLYLDQADVSEEMIEFNTTIGTGNAIEAIAAKTLTTTHFIKVTIPGALTRYIPCGTIA